MEPSARRPASRVAGLAAAALTAPLLVALPTLAVPRAAPHPVTPTSADLVVRGVQRSALPDLAGAPVPHPAAPPGAHPHVAPAVPTGAAVRTVGLLRADRTRRFSVLGVTWDRADAALPLDVQVRTRAVGGGWSAWEDLGGVDDAGADADSAEARVRPGTGPVWAGVADGVEVRVAGSRAPRGLRLALVDPGRSAADADARPLDPPPGSASADTGRPPVVSRAQWGADESLVRRTPDYAEPVTVGFVHHTDSTNAYSAAQSAAMVRGIFAYHVGSRGWNDIGYNVLVDRFGTVFEGRAGGLERGVVGAHTGGFNTHSFGVALLGTFDRVAPPRAMLRGLTRVLAWKLGLGYLDPAGRSTLLNHGFPGARYATGAQVPFAVVSGHRDADVTACPGARGYAALPGLRRAVRAEMGPSLVAPAVSPASRGLLDPGGFTVTGGAVNPLTWRLTVTDDVTGTVVRTVVPSGGAPAAGVSASWDRLDDRGLPVPAGTYDLRLEPRAGSAAGRPWTGQVTVVSPLSLEAPAAAGYGPLAVGGRAPAGSSVAVESRRAPSDWQPAATVTAGPDGRWAATLPLTDDVELRARLDTLTTDPRAVRLVPTAAQAAPAVYGDRVALTGTARPADQVSLHAAAPGRVVDLVATADAQGAWSASLDGVADWDVTPTARGASGAPAHVALTPTLDAAPDDALPLGSPVGLAGTAAPGAAVAVELRRPGAAWAAATRTSAGPDGRWAATVALPDDIDLRAAHAGLVSGTTRRVTVTPTAAAPAQGGYGEVVPLGGTGRPGADVVLDLAPADAGGAAPDPARSTGIVGPDGRWYLGWRLTGPTRWTVSVGGRPAGGGQVAVAPVIAPVRTAVAGLPLAVAGTAQPGVPVGLHLEAGAATADATATPGPDGRWSAALGPVAGGPAAVTATAAGLAARADVVVAAAVVSAPAALPLGGAVALGGLARPGSTVALQASARRHGGWSDVASLRAGPDGSWTAVAVLRDETAWRVVTPDGTSRPTTTGVVPTLRAPSRGRRGAVVVSGTARPGARVALLLRRRAGLWRRAATVVADPSGRWSARVRLRGRGALQAVADGWRSAVVAVRAG